MQAHLKHLGLARSPIFDRDLNVVAYELLYLSDKDSEIAHKFLQTDQDACDALINNFTSIYDSGSLRALPAFINVSEGFLRSDSLPKLSRHNLVVDIKQLHQVSPALLHSLERYVEAGYRLVLDDFDYAPEYDALLNLAKIVRVDIRKRTESELQPHLETLHKFKVTPLAEHIDNYTQYEFCHKLGFRLFQGEFLSRPTLLEGRQFTSNQAILIHLLAALQNPDVTPDELASVASRDPQLTFKLLRIVNSARYNPAQKIDSLTQAIIALGLVEVNKWATLLALSSNQDKPNELIRQILITARMCEYVASRTREVAPEMAFICGVMSLLDALLGVDQSSLLAQISVADEIAEAITGYEGKAGKLLQAVNFYMIGQSSFRLPPEVQEIYSEGYYEALRWSNETMQIMQGSNL
ncbi:EAL and HDOD domain-containing protein [Neptuniibacter halophilus]|uniref:EAL and HDOD domain-containing protein n=1 Tax=Neptuniibacter halophilus TaxID=651666 RepID=UPI00257279ED|nr:HDOD domain-containing protein [Neptuniibacter halophilus]